MVIKCWGCKKPALCMRWSKANGWFHPSCGICPVPDPTMDGFMFYLSSPASGEVKS
jgi:hypothetical protein